MTVKHPYKAALITGASRRIGAYLATCLAEHGIKVAIHYHYSDGEAETVAK